MGKEEMEEWEKEDDKIGERRETRKHMGKSGRKCSGIRNIREGEGERCGEKRLKICT